MSNTKHYTTTKEEDTMAATVKNYVYEVDSKEEKNHVTAFYQ
ncbi:MAG: hypothetical protein ACLRVD_07895 [Blautia caecimuris]